ncbi:hypothetical protein GCM10023080_087450 [Streptomyces pseudoechinosporeus]
MPLLDLDKITAGLSTTWSGFLRDWDRSLRSGNYPETTRYNYLLAAAQLARYLGEYSPDPDPDADGAAEDPVEVTRTHVEAFQAAHTGDTTSPNSYTLNGTACAVTGVRFPRHGTPTRSGRHTAGREARAISCSRTPARWWHAPVEDIRAGDALVCSAGAVLAHANTSTWHVRGACCHPRREPLPRMVIKAPGGT